ncbi:MAG TPA: signal recognition particle-docking protein FtsY [Thermoplasmata archaeon]|nr:signal recognition particle-docking protein FtsY [Thermoplasmata archaeon]HLA46600.1 signal recognition particle-docking protein FtsY [Thermoplasmata archaeon]
MFRFLREKLLGWTKKAEPQVEAVFGESGKKVDERKMEEILYDLEIALLESDVAFPVAKEIVDTLAEDLQGKRIVRGVELERAIEAALRSAVEKALSAKPMDFIGFVETAPKPVVVMFVGVNGTGKTTVIAKLADMLQKRGKTVVVAAADTFRAGAIEQLEVHAQRLGLKLIKHQAGADPAAVAYDAVEHAQTRGRDVVLIDTAGRMQTNQNLMDQMKKIKRVANPHMIIFVGDALAGNDAVEQAKQFNEAVGVDAAILCKIDADAKGGAALSIAHTIGKPILFVGTGQAYGDLVPFDAKWMIDRLFLTGAEA